MVGSGPALGGLRSLRHNQQPTQVLVSLKARLRSLETVGSLRDSLGGLLTSFREKESRISGKSSMKETSLGQIPWSIYPT